MSSVQCFGGRGKTSRRLGKVVVVERADYEGLEPNAKVQMILGLMHVE